MRTVLSSVALLALLSAPAGAVERLSGPVPAEVLEVVDGDTLAVRATVWLNQAVETRVRVDGIDTPETRSRCKAEKELAQEAKARLKALVARGDAQVRLLDVQDDKFGGRVRARVVLADGTDLAKTLIADGLARPYKGGKRLPWCGAGGVLKRDIG
ncbi:nuclease [Aerophototrophica crusticola]|uniref:Nuclease n=1 Tax=Aerophototrophica crusticola TaxID=1709002 RepID=A0A858R760_9PROT|nr:nuclease [Rhodospirillaceae bacterium B3]